MTNAAGCRTAGWSGTSPSEDLRPSGSKTPAVPGLPQHDLACGDCACAAPLCQDPCPCSGSGGLGVLTPALLQGSQCGVDVAGDAGELLRGQPQLVDDQRL